jgi:flagellar motor switch protein FliN
MNMSIDVMRNSYAQQFDEIKGIIAQTTEQIFGKPSQFTSQMDPGTDMLGMLEKESFPLVFIHFLSGTNGNQAKNVITLPAALVMNLYSWMLGEEPSGDKITDEHLDALKEATDQILGQIKISVSDTSGTYLVDQLNVFGVENFAEVAQHLQDEPGFCARITITMGDSPFTAAHYVWPAQEAPRNKGVSSVSNFDESDDIMDTSSIDVRPAEFEPMTDEGETGGSPRNVNMLLDVELEITVELGKKNMLISEILKIGKGSIIELQKSAGEPLDILVNGRKLAEGEVVVVDDHFGIRITQLASPRDRLKSLG